MPNRSYEKGARFERSVRKYLEGQGWWVVRQAKSAFPDLVALKAGETMLIECKDGGRFTGDEKWDLLILARRLEAKPVLAKKNIFHKIELEDIVS